MIINKILGKNNAKLIAEKYVEWLNSGISQSKILVLTFSSASKKNIINHVLKTTQKNVISDIKIHTFNGLIYNTLIDNWAELENTIPSGKPAIIPNLSGLEISQYLLKQIIKDEEVKGYNSKKSLLHQIFRRYSLIVNNNLTPQEVREKSQILNEAFGEDAEKIIQKLKSVTLNLRAFDNIRQAQIFSYVYKNTDYFKDIQYLIVEDADEATPLALDFIETISKQVVDKYILVDKKGCSRCGYLCADITAPQKLEKIFNESIKDEVIEQDRISSLEANILSDKSLPLKDLEYYSLSKRADMIDYAVDKIKNLISLGAKPKDISIITPIQDKMIKYMIESELTCSSPLFLSGSEKLADNPLVKAVLVMLKLSINLPVSEHELRIILSKYLGIPVKLCFNVDASLSEQDLGIFTDKYNEFRKNIEGLKSGKISLSEKAYYAYTKLFNKVSRADLDKFNFFLKELQNFEKIFGELSEESEKNIINQLENSIISDNPYSTLELSEEDLVVATPQKIIDNKINTKYQFWLDVSSQEWIKPDIGPLYNSWVFQKSWDKKEYSVEDNIRLSKQKTYRVLRKLMLNSEKVIALSSLFDTQGVENFGGIEGYLVSEDLPKSKKTEVFKIIPRDDQKPVLEYVSGKMAISAVPGAGKTTILLGLIIELLKRDISPENIYVLTYMESAARTFKDRITSAMNNSKLPNISTIHGLALRILKENANYERLGLNPDFEICDDTKRGNIIKSLSDTIQKQDMEDFDRAVSVLKLSKIDYDNNSEIIRLLKLKKGTQGEMKLVRFLKFFFNYQKTLQSENLIDYDDILISAVKLLEENPDILEYYQNICEYIIEDEAQDSSSIQQRLINLLSAKYNNLIRCGDINQAITTTFTNADVDGFKSFINTSQRVNMDCSQRCSEGVWSLANKLVKFGNSRLNSPFYEIYMKPVEGKNPQEKVPVVTKIYSTGAEEKTQTVKEIQNILTQNPKATIGILLRNNYQVNNWADYLNTSGLTAITRNECLGQKKIFKIIFSILKFIAEPYNNEILACAYKSLSDCGMFKPHLEKIIENFDKSFITLDNDDISDSDLSRFHWDMNYWLSFPELGIDEMATMIGLYYFSDNLEKSNIHLISTLCSKLDNGNFSQTVQRLEDLSQRPTLSGFKFFSEDEEKDLTGGKVQIMTLHKSKGDEFDYVFLPELSEKNLTLDISQLKLKKSSDFIENVRGLSKDYTPKSEQELKEFLVSENYRLLYVAITRAKKRLYFSTPATETYYGKQKDIIPSIIFDELL